MSIADRPTLSPASAFDTKAVRAPKEAGSCQCPATAINCNLSPAPTGHFGDLEFDSVARTVLDRTVVVSAPAAEVRSWDRRFAAEDSAELAGTFRRLAEFHRRGIAGSPAMMGCSKDSDSQDRTSLTSPDCRRAAAVSASKVDCSRG